MIRRHLSYANVTATLALVLALGTGAVYAAGEIGSRDLANNSVRTQDLKDRRGVTGEDVRRNSLGGKQIDEASLVGARVAAISGSANLGCDPSPSIFVDCVSESLELHASSRLLVIVTGGFVSEADDANVECEIRVDGEDASLSDLPGEVSDNTDGLASDGFARTFVTDALAPGTHSAALACQQLGPEDARIESPTIAVLAVRTGN
jgi:hypothetical protein